MLQRLFYSFLLLASLSCREAATHEDPLVTSTPIKPVNTDTATVSPASWKGILKMSDADFTKKIAATPGLTVIDFSAEWCGPCKKLHPILESLANEMEGKVNFGNVDVDESPNIAAGLNITGIPLLVFYKDGKIVDKLVGLLPEADLKAKINEHL